VPLKNYSLACGERHTTTPQWKRDLEVDIFIVIFKIIDITASRGATSAGS